MLWYKHWLELRWRLLLMVLGALVTAAFLQIRIDERLTEYANTGLARNVEAYASLLQPMGTESLLVWSEFTNYLGTLLMFGAPLMALGSGFAGTQIARHPSIFFTLSLPVSRWRLVWTRFVVDWLGLVFASVFFTAAAAVVLNSQGRSLPWEPILISGAVGLLATAPVLAVFEALNLAGGAIALVGIVVGFLPWILFMAWTWGATKNVAAHATSPIIIVVVATLGTMLAMGFAAALIREKEY